MITEARIATTDGSILNVERDNITLSGLQTLQAVSLVAGDVVLVTGQVDGTQNGPYVVASGAWSRHPDHDTGAEFVRPWEIFIREGSYANWRFQFANSSTPTLGTSVINFAPFSRDAVERTGASLIENTPGTFDLQNTGVIPHTWGFASPTVGADGRISYNINTPSTEAYIIGMRLTYFSSTQVQVEIGGCYDFSTGKILFRGSPAQIGLGAKPTSDFIYLYSHDAGDGDAIHTASTTAPVDSGITAPGNGYYMSGNNTERYIGNVRTDASTNPYRFKVEQFSGNTLLITYLEDMNALPFLVLNGASATTETTVNLGPSGLKLVPPTCRMARLRMSTNATAAISLGTSEDSVTLSGVSYLKRIGVSQTGIEVDMPLDASQAFAYLHNVAGGATNVSVVGYIDRR